MTCRLCTERRRTIKRGDTRCAAHRQMGRMRKELVRLRRLEKAVQSLDAGRRDVMLPGGL